MRKVTSHRRMLVIFLFFLSSWNLAKSEVVIANFQADYLAGTTAGQTRPQRSADGWNYMQNASGSIGNSANYTSLVWATGTSQYLPTSTGPSVPAVWFDAGKTKVHPGDGSVHSILAYTVQAGEAGISRIASSSIYVPGSSSNGITYSIFVDNTQIGTTTTLAKQTNGSFNVSLGSLSVGQTVYVAVGNNGSAGSDTTEINFQILSTVPEPGTLLLGGIAAACGGGGVWWKRRRRPVVETKTEESPAN